MIIDEDDYLAHYGILRRSGRYPWGSGRTENARNKSFLDHVADLRKQGLSDTEIARGFGISTTQLRAAKTIAKAQQKQANILMAERLKEKGYSHGAIAERMGLAGESSVRALLADGAKDRAAILTATSDAIKAEVDAKRFVDVGSGVEQYMNISKEKLNAAVAVLEEQGYQKHTVKITQLGTGHETELKVLSPPGTTQREVWENRFEIKQMNVVSNDGGRTVTQKVFDPISVDPKRVAVKYKEDGGDKADGVIYVREGVDDVSLGGNRYAQVRVKVGDGHYLKGMAMYSNDLPPGVDLVFNTNKSSTGNKLDAMKGLKDDPDLPFGSIVDQIKSPDGTRVTSAMNLVNREGDWGRWSKSLSSQMLSKQSPSLAKSQLDLTFERRKNELARIKSLTNPTIKRKLLEKFAEGTDSAAVQLKAAHLPRQASHVILPISSMPPSQIYAPNYRDGERVVLIRYPHGGTFEIPELTVNNKHPEAVSLLNNVRDAVGIHHSVAERLSGADFDGDTVLVIPNNQGKVRTSNALEQLKGFDPMKYKIPDDSPMRRMDARTKGIEMGNVSNLITDMTIRAASHEDIARAVRHSMVVIDAEKHGLDWKQSAIDNNIRQLKQEYQGSGKAGASTLISRATSEVRVPERKPRPMSEGGPIDRATGRKVFVETNRTTSNGKPRTIKSEKLAETDDAFTLVSEARTPMERLYAQHSNRLKDLANQARLASINTPALQYSPSAARTYANQVSSLNSKLALALRNAPLERQAQVIANAQVRAKRDANPNLDSDELRKIRFRSLEDARERMGAGKPQIEITQDEWDAIQAGAISNDRLSRILTHADLDVVTSLALPHREITMTPAVTARAQRMLDDGYTRAEVADHLGISVTTLDTTTSAVE